MIRKIAFGLLWVGFAIYAIGFAPPNKPDTFELIKNLSLGQLEGINPLIVALFYIMGVWPAIYACLMLFDGRMQKIPAWPFVVASFGIGAFIILPYLALREPNQTFKGSKTLLLKLLDSRGMGFALTIVAIALVAYGLLAGNWADYVYQFQTRRFIHVMSLDFCLLCLLFPTLLRDDMARRGINNSVVFWLVSLIPLLGPLAYLCLRSPLPEASTEVAQRTVASSTR